MSLKDVNPGKYIAKAVEGAWAEVGKKSTRAVGIKFEFHTENGEKEEIWHIMYLTETVTSSGLTVTQKTFDTLALLGYNESNDLIKKGDSYYFDKSHLADKEVQIVIVHETDESNPSKVYTKVKYVNELNSNRLSGLSVDKIMSNDKLKSEMAAARARIGAPKPTQKTTDVPW